MFQDARSFGFGRASAQAVDGVDFPAAADSAQHRHLPGTQPEAPAAVRQSPRLRAAHLWERADHGFYIEPRWVDRRLFDVERFEGEICDPCAGRGHILEAAASAGYESVGYDIVNRGPQLRGIIDFLAPATALRADNIVANPPFSLLREFVIRALQIARRKVAVVTPTRRLNAAGVWLEDLPLIRVWYLTPRPSMPPADVFREYELRGREPSGGTQDYCWLVFEHGHRGPATISWLRRDPSVPGLVSRNDGRAR
jgi:hypothetical protein